MGTNFRNEIFVHIPESLTRGKNVSVDSQTFIPREMNFKEQLD